MEMMTKKNKIFRYLKR